MKNIQKQNLKIAKIVKAFTLSLIISSMIFANTAQASPINENNITVLVNNERVTRGLEALRVDPDLSTAAKLKSNHMLNKNYFAHFAFGLTPWMFMRNAGYDYMLAGENLAMDFNTSEGAVKAWMASPRHRDNILNPEFTDIGVGVVSGAYTENGVTHETTIVTNMFGQKKPRLVKVIESLRRYFSLY